ncbi:MAG: hypothetical protein K8M05_21275 [Deltaproteobacteria bacterium]|nr:hypothetical protein [Kofleriaceae bacterium]
MRDNLDRLVSSGSNVVAYRDAMTTLGTSLGNVVAKNVPSASKVLVAFTVEDADYLASGVLRALAQKRAPGNLSVACFWNERIRLGQGGEVEEAPIVHQYVEPHPERVSALVMVKSIISTSCVVRTNLLRLLDETKPKHIFVVAPVLYKDARASLEKEFPDSVAAKFRYVYFAVDSKRTKDGLVVPGIGGSVYELLGLGTSTTKNRVRPALVAERRHQIAAG